MPRCRPELLATVTGAALIRFDAARVGDYGVAGACLFMGYPSIATIISAEILFASTLKGGNALIAFLFVTP